MFEHRKQTLLPRRIFYARLARALGLGTVIILCSLAIGMAGYHYLEKLSWLDAFVNAAMILSGMGPLAQVQTSVGKLFAGCYALFSGIAFLTSIGVVFAPVFHRFLHKFHLEGISEGASTTEENPDSLKGGRRKGTGRHFKILSGILCGTIILAGAGCASTSSEKTLHRFDFTSAHMGTLFSISLYASEKSSAETAAEAGFKRIATLDEMMSDYRADSELMRLCDQPFGKPVPVSQDLFTILERSQQTSKLTAGAFDATIGPFTHLWRFSRKRKALPSAEQISEARAAFGWQKLRLDPKTRTATLLVPNMRLDLGGIAKGYAAEQALRILNSHGITRALVAASGDLAIGDPPPGERGWKIGITPIDSHTNDLAASLMLHNAGVSTAGDTEQAIEINGTRYSHIVDPSTGLGLTNRIQVTVIARDATISDGLDTGLCVLGAEKALRVVDSLPHVAAVILTKENGTVRILKSRRFARALEKTTAP
jgi:thiamine biosynthesis lipoprotein